MQRRSWEKLWPWPRPWMMLQIVRDMSAAERASVRAGYGKRKAWLFDLLCSDADERRKPCRKLP